MDTKFKCTKCGSCCRNLNKSNFKNFHLDKLDRGDGTCKYLLENNLCAIYLVRPIYCRIEEGYHVYFKHIPYENYMLANYFSCIDIQNFEIKKMENTNEWCKRESS